ncbi:hypothetical protein GMA19_02112 [Paenibacillus polymyxa E681]|nr:hypothetical protein GE561_02112 [Paenibacillus polymyxa E681]QNV61785.1 hypothetical protein GMA19_02112 [Paenibacillus polymyxa E681]
MNKVSQQILKPLKRQTVHKSEAVLLVQRLFDVARGIRICLDISSFLVFRVIHAISTQFLHTFFLQ